MQYNSNNRIIVPCFHSCDGIITEVNKEFIEFTGYILDELLGKSLIQIGDMIRINSQILLNNINSNYSGYIFTRSLEGREVDILRCSGKEANEEVYTFAEKPNSRLSDKLMFQEQTFEKQNKIIEQQKEWLEKQNKQLEKQNKQLEQQKEQLEVKNTQLINIIENLSEAVVITDNKGEFIMVNPKARSLIYQSDKVIAFDEVLNTTKYFDMEGNEVAFENMPGIRALRGEKAKNIRMFVSNPDKDYYIDCSAVPIYNTNGDLTMVISCFQDITEIIEQSRKIEEQKKELDAIIENIADGISIFDDKGQYILFNKAAREMFFPTYEYMDKAADGYKQSELYDVDGKKIDIGNIPASRVKRGEKFKNMRMAVKFPHKTLQIDVSGTPIYDSKGKFRAGILCSRDMTEYFEHEEVIKSRYEFLNRMIDTFDLPVVRLSSTDLKVVGINKKAFSTLKLIRPDIISISQLKERCLEDLFKHLKPFDRSKYHQYIDEVIKEKKTKYLNKQSYLINGKQVYWNVIFEPILGINGQIQEVLIIVIDVTDEVESNKVMEQALSLQGDFLANISHELKTPLNVIFSAVQLFSMYCSSGSLDDKKNSIIKYIDSIKHNSYRLSKLINNIVDTSKIEAGFFELNLSNNNIVEVVEDIVMSVANFADSKGLNIIFDTDVEEKMISCDPENIERILLNLISNAIKFSNDGDAIFIEIKDRNEFVEISVKDNGVGIKDKHLGMIFDRFKQVDKSLSRNAEGTGIGLSLVKSIVELHGGNISVESEFEKGSKFTVSLPARKVTQENMLLSNKLRNRNDSVQVEFSDIYS